MPRAVYLTVYLIYLIFLRLTDWLPVWLTICLFRLFWTGSHGNDDRGFTLMILGGVMFLPGSYASFILFGAWLGWRGFDYNMVPSYDD